MRKRPSRHCDPDFFFFFQSQSETAGVVLEKGETCDTFFLYFLSMEDEEHVATAPTLQSMPLYIKDGAVSSVPVECVAIGIV